MEDLVSATDGSPPLSSRFPWSGERVFVTGATGIVGSWLVKALLDRGAYVVALVRDWDPQSELVRSGLVQRVNVVSGALEDFGAIERAVNQHEISTVFHLGAQTIVGTAFRNPLPTFEANLRGTYHLLEACRVHSSLVQRVVIASSDKAYGDSDTLPYTEDMPLNGMHPYDVSKSCTDLLSLCYGHTYGLPVTIARCGNIFGGGDLNWSRIVPGTIRSVLDGQRPTLRSDGTNVRDYVYVDDIVDAYILLAEHATATGIRGEAFNFGPGCQVSVLTIANLILELMGRADLEPIVLGRTEGEIKHQYLDSSKAQQRLGWRPRFDLDEGLRRTIEWYRGYLA